MNDIRHYNYLMLQLSEAKKSGATTLDTTNPTIFAALREAQSVITRDHSKLTGWRERFFAEKDVALAKWALSLVNQNSNRHATQRATINDASNPEPRIHEDLAEPAFPDSEDTDLEAIMNGISKEEWASIIRPEELSTADRRVASPPTGSAEESPAERMATLGLEARTEDPVLRELFWMKLSKNDLRSALLKTEEVNETKDTIHSVHLLDIACHYRYRHPEFFNQWTDLVRALKSKGLAVRLEEWGVRLTEQGKAWLNEASGSAGTV